MFDTSQLTWIRQTTVLGKGSHPAHPIHKHNTKAFFLGTGTGRFPAATVWEAFQRNTTGLNLVNPPLRGTSESLVCEVPLTDFA